ncbi:hypothetical protein [Streptomyces sp. NBC_01171]|uniref:MmyB family transcriptional regulator n=1 Tax=Streptomyces sp. NBC_01171 TaxID=2903757 RepID=UPI003869819C
MRDVTEPPPCPAPRGLRILREEGLQALQRGPRELRGDHRVAGLSRVDKVLRHPLVGELTLDRDALACAGDPDQQLVVRTAEPGTPSHDGLRILSSWAADAGRDATRGRCGGSA